MLTNQKVLACHICVAEQWSQDFHEYVTLQKNLCRNFKKLKMGTLPCISFLVPIQSFIRRNQRLKVLGFEKGSKYPKPRGWILPQSLQRETALRMLVFNPVQVNFNFWQFEGWEPGSHGCQASTVPLSYIPWLLGPSEL